LTSYVTIVHHVPLNEFLLYKNLLKFTFTPSYFSLLVYAKRKQKFICGIYDVSDSAGRNLFTSKNSVIKFYGGIVYLGEKIYTS